MLLASFGILGVTLLLGIALASFYLATAAKSRPPWMLSAAHGLFALCGYAVLVTALQGTRRGNAGGAGSFGLIAAILLGVALLLGLGLVTARLRRRRTPPMVVGLHATLAVAGFVILTAYASIPG